jgi:solute carrier family 6 GABA transporter-like protein 1
MAVRRCRPLTLLQVIFLFYCFRWEPVKYGTVEYPTWAHSIGQARRLSSRIDTSSDLFSGFMMSFSSMVWIPGYAIYWMLTTRGSVKDVSACSRCIYRHQT